jgi:hypothetical protein
MRWLLALSTLAIPTLAAADTLTVGSGVGSCATAFLPANRGVTRAWILGFWSGMNWEHSAQVGSSTDNNGIVAEVEQSCGKAPSFKLVIAVNYVYNEMAKAGR